MVAIFAKMAAFAAVVGVDTAAVNVRDLPFHSAVTLVEPAKIEIAEPVQDEPTPLEWPPPLAESVQSEANDTQSDVTPPEIPAQADDSEEKKELPKKSDAPRRSTKSTIEDAMSDDMKQEDRAIRSLSRALEHYSNMSKKTQELVEDQDTARSEKDAAAKAVEDAMATLHDAKAKRFEAAKLDMLTNPLTGETSPSRKRLTTAEDDVVAAEERLVEVQKLAHTTESLAERAEDKAEKALEKQAEYEEQVKQAGQEAEGLSKTLQKAQDRQAREADRTNAAVTALEKQKAKMEAAMDKAIEQGSAKVEAKHPSDK